jgi:hypothetical protein
VRYCHHLASVVRPLTFHILIYSSETTGPYGTKLGRKHLYNVLYKVSSFRPIPPTDMATKGNSCYWLANVKKIFSSETDWPNGAKLGRKHLCKILYKTSSFGSIRPTNMAGLDLWILMYYFYIQIHNWLTLYNYWLWNRLLSGFINLKKCNIHRAAGEVNIRF